MGKIVETYARNTPRSAEADRRARQSVSGGNSRGAAVWLPHTLTIQRAAGPWVADVDGREYIDLINNFTSLVHGHAYPPIVDVATRRIEEGTAWTANNPWQIELAETLIERVSATESVRFTNSGTEAGMLALEIARTVTGRPKVLIARSGFHGSLLGFEVGPFDGKVHLHGADTTHVGTYNDAGSFERLLERHGSEIAAVFLEPVMGAGGVQPAAPEFLEAVRRAAHEAGALLVFDEVMSFRLSTGGAQANLGIEPDLTMFGKVIGGGFPVGAVGGRREYLKIFGPEHPRSVHSGTFVGNPLTMSAGLVSVRELTKERIDRMNALCARLDASLVASARRHGLPFSTRRSGSLMNLFFQDEAPETAAMRSDRTPSKLFYLAALNHGLLLATRGMIALSTVMDEALIDEAAERADAAMADVSAELESTPSRGHETKTHDWG